MAAGFVHGVLNTDNMNINGESFDYGPYRFLPHNDVNFVAAYFDEGGRYAFGRQPRAVAWNLQQLAGCLALVSPPEPLSAALNGFGTRYTRELATAMVERMGLTPLSLEADTALADAAFTALAAGGPDLGWEPFFFDWFGGAASQDRALGGPRAGLYDQPAFVEFRKRFEGHAPADAGRLALPYFQRPDPESLLYDEIETLWGPITANDDWSLFDAKIVRLGDARAAYGLTGDLAPDSAAPTS
jgi:uncharacterized protein YdiU (UPF0061 family)